LRSGHRPEVIDLLGVVVSDRNASSDYDRYVHSSDGLLMVDRDRVFARYWNQPDPIEKYVLPSSDLPLKSDPVYEAMICE
jgi:hypothetical protein